MQDKEELISNVLPWTRRTDKQVLDNQLEIIYNSSVCTQDVVDRTRPLRCTIETSGETESWISVLAAHHNRDAEGLTLCRRDMGVHKILNGINPKENVIGRLEIETLSANTLSTMPWEHPNSEWTVFGN